LVWLLFVDESLGKLNKTLINPNPKPFCYWGRCVSAPFFSWREERGHTHSLFHLITHSHTHTHTKHMQQGTIDLMVDEKESVSEWKVVSRSRSASLGDTHLTLLQVLFPLLSLLLFFGLVQSVLEATVSVLGRHSPHSSPGFFSPLPFSNTQVTLLKVLFSLEFFCSSLSLSLARTRSLSHSLSLPPPPLNFAISLSLYL